MVSPLQGTTETFRTRVGARERALLNVSTVRFDRRLTFAQYYVQPICSPTRASLLTGRYSIHTGSEHLLWGPSEPSCLPLATPLMPKAFKIIGYQTHMVGKWHLGYVNESCTPWRRGFDSYLGYLNGNEGYYHHGTECPRPL